MARPLKVVNEEEVYKLARLGCTTEEIGDFLGVSHDTISRRFANEMSLGLSERKISLRRYQWKSAKSGSVPMLIHLGKQYLGQSDKHEFNTREIPDAELIARASSALAGSDSPGSDDPEAGGDAHTDLP